MFIFLIVVIALAIALEFLSLHSGVSQVSVDFSLSAVRAEPGEMIQNETTVNNMGKLPVSYLCVRMAYPLCAILPEDVAERGMYLCTVSDVYRFWFRKKIKRTMSFSIEKRGVHIIAGKDIQRGDFLGFQVSTANLTQRREVLIYPQRLENSALVEALGEYCGEMSARRWLIRDPILTIGVREYTGNEPMRTISWSQTARRGELTVREFDFTRSVNCALLFCLDGIDYDETALMDTCCSTIRTISEELASRGVETDFFTNSILIGYKGFDIRSCTASEGKMQELLDILARATALRCCHAENMVDYCLNTRPNAAAYIILAGRDGEDIQRAMERLEARTGQRAMLITADSLEVGQ